MCVCVCVCVCVFLTDIILVWQIFLGTHTSHPRGCGALIVSLFRPAFFPSVQLYSCAISTKKKKTWMKVKSQCILRNSITRKQSSILQKEKKITFSLFRLNVGCRQRRRIMKTSKKEKKEKCQIRINRNEMRKRLPI